MSRGKFWVRHQDSSSHVTSSSPGPTRKRTQQEEDAMAAAAAQLSGGIRVGHVWGCRTEATPIAIIAA